MKEKEFKTKKIQEEIMLNSAILRNANMAISNEIDSKQRLKHQSNAYLNDNFKLYMSKVGNHSILSFEEQQELCKKIVAGDEKAAQILYLKNLKLVISIAKKKFRYTKATNLTLDDLVQEGNIGLLKAIEKFDYTMNNKFSTYASFWIDRYITFAISQQGSMIRIPVHTKERINLITRLKYEYIQNYHVKPTDEQLYNYVLENSNDEFSWDVFRKLLCVKDVISYDDLMKEDGSEKIDFISADDSNSNDDKFKKANVEKSLNVILYIVKSITRNETICARNAEMFMIRNGLIDGKEYTLAAMADAYGITIERVRQIEIKIMERIAMIVKNQKVKADMQDISSFDEFAELLDGYLVENDIKYVEAEKTVEDMFTKAKVMVKKISK